jgi:DNA-binding SARP family transcriptional activator
VAGLLWLDSSEERACGNLRSTLWRLRRPGQIVAQDSLGRLILAPTVAVDLREAIPRMRALLDTALECEPGDVTALASLGEVLPDWDEDWVVIERERFRQLRLHALEALCERLTGEARFAEALEIGLAAIAAEPLRESAQRALVRVHLAEGNPGEAVRQYRSYRRLLRDEMDLEPSLQMEELVRGLTPR